MDTKLNDANSNIKQILNSFGNYVTILENPIWAKTAKAEEIKSAFKLGYFLEKIMAHFISRNSLPEFINMLNKWWNKTNHYKVYTEKMFLFACDHLLIKFFKCENIREITLDIAIRVYSSIFSRKRLQKVLSSVILLSSSYEAVTDFASNNMTSNEENNLEYCLKITNWSNLLQSGHENDIRVEVANSLSLYKVESALYTLIGILNLSDVSESEELVQNIILDHILQKMLDRSILSSNFWSTLFKQVKICYVCNTCNNFKKFLTNLFNFIIYIGSMMRKEDNMWKYDITISLCPVLSYHDLLAFIKNIYNITNLKQYVIQRLNEAKEYTDCCIWDKIKQEL